MKKACLAFAASMLSLLCVAPARTQSTAPITDPTAITDAVAHQRALAALGPDVRTSTHMQTTPQGITETMHCIGLQRYHQDGTLAEVHQLACSVDWAKAIANIEKTAEAIKRTDAMANLPKAK